MNITWIVGNGFDINLGLKTGYTNFWQDCYLKSPDEHGYREALFDAFGGEDEFNKAKLWSDLEALLGKASGRYKLEDKETFIRTFEEMQSLFTAYVYEQETRLPDVLPDDAVQEFKKSVVAFDRRMAQQDYNHFALDSVEENVTYNFISLNYTTILDKFVGASTAENGLISQHRLPGLTYNDYAQAPFHVHGSIASSGENYDVVFGVDSVDQMDGKEMAKDPDIQELWVKSQKNTSLFRNNNEDVLGKLIDDAQVICVYGCSLGKSDSRIWHKVAQQLIRSEDVRLVLFIYGLPNQHHGSGREYQHWRGDLFKQFPSVSGIADEQFSNCVNRIFLVPSTDYFKFGDLTTRGK